MRAAIVHVASGREWRGGQRQVWLLARELGRRGVSQAVVTTAGSELARRLAADGITVLAAHWTIGLDPRVLPTILRAMKSAVLLHAHDAHALALAGLAVLPSRVPLIVTRRVTFPLRRRFFWLRACRIIAISRAVRDALVADGIDPARIVVIPSAIDPNLFQSDDLGPSALLPVPRGARLAVHLGALTAEKDQRTLIRAAARLVQDLPNLHWVIVGEGPLHSELQRQITECRVNDRVHLLGALADPDRVLAKADIFVMSSTSEGLGTSALAAMARGVPVIATRVGGLPELLGSGGGVLVEPSDPGALADAVRRVLNDSELRSRLAATGREVAQAYALGPMADQVLSVYRSCAHSFDGS